MWMIRTVVNMLKRSSGFGNKHTAAVPERNVTIIRRRKSSCLLVRQRPHVADDKRVHPASPSVARDHKMFDRWLPRDAHIPVHLRLQLRGEQPPLQECEAVQVSGEACL